jgi:hypothetical protein
VAAVRADLVTLLVVGRGLVLYRVADPGWRLTWNRYPPRTIGVGIVTGRLCWSLVWALP